MDFEKEILPILKNNCLACHNQTKPKGGLVLETPQTIRKGGEAGPAVVPKNPAESLLLKAASHRDPELIMPPPDNKAAASPLKPEELGLVQLWIEQGAAGEVRTAVPISWQPLPPAINTIFAVALTRDGEYAACGRGNQITLYQLPLGRFSARLQDPRLRDSNPGAAHRDTVNSLAFSPDGERLASGGYREVKIWRRSHPAEKFKLPAGTALLAGSEKWIAAALPNGDLRLLDRNGKVARMIKGERGPATVLRFAAGTNALVVARGKMLEMISAPAGTLIATSALQTNITALAPVGADGMAVACADGSIQLFTPTATNHSFTAAKDLKSPAPAAFLECVATNRLLAGSPDGTVRLWDLAAGKIISEINHGSPLTALAARPDGKQFATAGGVETKIWGLPDAKMTVVLKGDGRAAWLVTDQERELTFARSEIDFRKSGLRTAETNEATALAAQKKAGETNAALARVLDQKKLALTNAIAAQADARKAVEDLGPEISKLVETFFAAEKESTNAAALAKAAGDSGDKAKSESLAKESEAKAKALAEAKVALDKLPAESKAGQKIAVEKVISSAKAVGEAEKEVRKAEQAHAGTDREHQLATEGLKKTQDAVAAAAAALTAAEAAATNAQSALTVAKSHLSKTERPAAALCFSTDNAVLLSAHEDGTLRWWSADTGAQLDAMETKPESPLRLAVSGGSLALISRPGGAAAYDFTPAWVLERVIGTGDATSPLADRVNCVAFSPDGNFLFSGGGEPTRRGEIKAWRVKDGSLARDFPNVHSDSVFALAVSGDGKYLASGAADRFAKVVDVETGKVLRSFEGHTHHVLGVAWKRDGRTLLTAGADNIAKVWDAQTGERRKNIEGFAREVTAAAYVGIMDEAVLGAGDGQVVLVKGNGDKVRSYPGGSDYVYAVAATPDDSLVIGGGADGILRVWNGKDGKLRNEFR